MQQQLFARWRLAGAEAEDLREGLRAAGELLELRVDAEPEPAPAGGGAQAQLGPRYRDGLQVLVAIFAGMGIYAVNIVCAIYNGVCAIYNGAPFNGALYIMVHHLMARYIYW